MYRHLLVPIDNTNLSTITVSKAVELASALGARVTFFLAAADHSASLHGDAEIMRMTAPEEFVYNFEGRARELLTKAESAARAQGVPCSSVTLVSDHPHSAILDAARKEGCDLIFMASHGRRSNLEMMLGSQTLKVLLNSEIPVLVSAIADPQASGQAIAAIRDEHQSLGAVLHAWLHVLKPSAQGPAAPDPVLMKAMVHYIQAFPMALHHPKEEEYLFRKLRQRTSALNPELDELERQHARDYRLVTDLAAVVDKYAEGLASAQELEKAVSAYAQFIWEHMGREEGVILPEAQRYLTDADWSEINAAFSKNQDPRFGGDTDTEFRHLFSRIVNLAKTGAETPGNRNQ